MPKKSEKNNILTDEEILKMAAEGSNSAYEFMLLKYRNLVKTIARKYYIAGADNEDVIQEGTIGLFKAIRDFDDEGGSSFGTFARLCIERQIQTAVSGANRDKHKILNESVPLDSAAGSEEAIAAESIPAGPKDDPEDLTLMRESISAIIELSEKVLSPLEARVFRGLMGGKDYKDIASDLGKSPKSIDNAIQRIRRKIQV